MQDYEKYSKEMLIQEIRSLQENLANFKISEEKLKLLISSMDDLIFVMDKEKKITFYHVSDESHLYAKPENFLNKKIDEIMPPHVSELFNEAFKQVKIMKSSNFEYSLKIKGKTKWYNLQLSPIVIEEKFDRALSVIRDITELKNAESKVLESAKLWEDTFRSTADAIMILDKDHNIIQANNKMLDIYKIKLDELTGKKCWEVVHNTENFILECPFECAKKSNKRESMELQFDNKWYLVSTDPILNSQNEITGAVHIMSDITERKKAEESVLELNRNLDHRIKELGLLLNISQTLIRTKDLNNILQYITDSSSKIIGLDSAAIYLVNDDQLYLGASTPPVPDEFPKEFRFAKLKEHQHIKKSLISAEPVIVADVSRESFGIKEKEIFKFRKFKSLLYIPLLIERRAVGVLVLGTMNSLHEFTNSEINLLKTLSVQSALAIENALLNKESKIYSGKLEENVIQLKNAEQKLLELNSSLEIRVQERTEELETSLNEVERMNQLFVGREFRIKELRDQIKLMKDKLK